MEETLKMCGLDAPKISCREVKNLPGDDDFEMMNDDQNCSASRFSQLFTSKIEKNKKRDESGQDFSISPLEYFFQPKISHLEYSQKISKNNENGDEKSKTILNEKLNNNRKKSQNKERGSSMMISLYSKENSWKRKFIIFLKNFLIPHLIADIFIVLVSLSHTFCNEFCFMKPICSCDNNFAIKMYTASIILFSDHGFFAFGIYVVVVSIYLSNNRKMDIILHFFHFSICLILSFLYILWSSEDQNYNEWPIHIINFSSTSIFLMIVGIFKYKFDLKEIWKNLSKTSMVSAAIMTHYILIRIVFPFVNSYLPDNIANYIIPFYQLLYFRLINTIFLKVIQIYYDLASTFYKSIPPIVLNLQIRFFHTFLFTVPLTSIVNLNFDSRHLVKWLLLISYANCLILTYTRVDIMTMYIYFPLYRIIFCRKKIQAQVPLKLNENEIQCLRIVSGNLLDIIYVINARLILWLVLKIWIIRPTNKIFYKNCGFEMDFSFFQVNEYGIISIFLINLFITLGIVVYMIIKGRMVFEYKTDVFIDAKILNVISFIYFSVIVDFNIQIIYSIK